MMNDAGTYDEAASVMGLAEATSGRGVVCADFDHDGCRFPGCGRKRWFFRRPDGRAVPACGYRPEDITDDGLDAVDEYFEAADSSAEASVRSRPPAEHRARS